MSGGSGRLARGWQAVATVLLNSLVFLLLLNLALALAFATCDRMSAGEEAGETARHFTPDGAPVDNGRRTDWQLAWIDFGAYDEDADPARAAAVLDEFHALAQLGFVYQPWAQFSEPPFDGEWVHVDLDARGRPHRRTLDAEAGGAAGRLRIFTFGGSTTFGYSVADADTWPSFLSAALARRAQEQGLDVAVEVRNYGRGYYNPGQELALLTDLLRDGARPDLVIFMDGVNWGPEEDVPYFTPQIARAFHRAQFPERPSLVSALGWVPMVRLARELGAGLRPDRVAAAEGATEDPEAEAEAVRHALARFEANRRMAGAVARDFDVPALFFLQPDALRDYPLDLLRKAPPPDYLRQRRLHARFHAALESAEGWIDLGHLFSAFGRSPKPILDDVHYGPPFNRFVAEAVAAHVDLGALAARARERAEVAPGGDGAQAGPSGPVRALPPFGP